MGGAPARTRTDGTMSASSIARVATTRRRSPAPAGRSHSSTVVPGAPLIMSITASRLRPVTGSSPTRSIVSPGTMPAESAGPSRRTATIWSPAGTASTRTPIPPKLPVMSSSSAARSFSVKYRLKGSRSST